MNHFLESKSRKITGIPRHNYLQKNHLIIKDNEANGWTYKSHDVMINQLTILLADANLSKLQILLQSG